MTSSCTGASCTWSRHLIHSLPAEVICGQKILELWVTIQIAEFNTSYDTWNFSILFLIHDQLDVRQSSLTGHSQPSGASILFPRSFNCWAKICLSTTVFMRQTKCVCVCVCSVAQLYLTLCDPHGLYPNRLLCPWDFPGKNIGVGCHFLLQEIFPTQGSSSCLLHLLYGQVALYHCAAWEG